MWAKITVSDSLIVWAEIHIYVLVYMYVTPKQEPLWQFSFWKFWLNEIPVNEIKYLKFLRPINTGSSWIPLYWFGQTGFPSKSKYWRIEECSHYSRHYRNVFSPGKEETSGNSGQCNEQDMSLQDLPSQGFCDRDPGFYQ